MSIKIIKSCNRPVKIVRTTGIIKIVSTKQTSAIFVPFSFTATDGQTVFPLPSAAKSGGLFMVSINGAPQDQEGGDYTVSGVTLTFDEGLDTNDKVYGAYEQA
ncbi:MAG: hypothetical protein JRJ39_00335 [Deltaproteobacteria bacterium]|nr:hypothetical protein [Deltaproteobacteria bacterium]